MNLTSLESDRGGLLVLLMNNLFSSTALNLLPVLLTKNRYNYNEHEALYMNSNTSIPTKLVHILHHQQKKRERKEKRNLYDYALD